MAQERSSSRSTCSLDTAVVCAACFVGVGLKPLQRGSHLSCLSLSSDWLLLRVATSRV